MKNSTDFDLLLSLPPNMCGHLENCEPAVAERAYSTFDPPGQQLGSGGGTAYVLEQAWRDSGKGSFSQWLDDSGKLIIHGGGESRRLPPYAAPGKLFIPMPVFRWSLGQRLDQTLLDVAEPTLQKMAGAASENARVMVASGDVLVRLDGKLPEIPDADVVFFGLWVKPEEAQNFGVMFCDPDSPDKLVTFLQKPTPDAIREKSRNSAFLIDVGIWLLSERAVNCLMKKSGWDAETQTFTGEVPDTYDLYGSWVRSIIWEGDCGSFSCSSPPLKKPQALDTDSLGRLHVLDKLGATVFIFDPANGAFQGSYGGYGTDPGKMILPMDVLISETGSALVTDGDRIEVFDNP